MKAEMDIVEGVDGKGIEMIKKTKQIIRGIEVVSVCKTGSRVNFRQ